MRTVFIFFHGFGTSGGRIILKMMGIDAIVPHIAVCNFLLQQSGRY